MDFDLGELRRHVEFLFSACSFESCAFLAGKLVALSRALPSDVFLLARAQLALDRPLRAVELLEYHRLVSSDLSFVLLASQCFAAANRQDDVLRVTDACVHPDDVQMGLLDDQKLAQELQSRHGVDQLSALSLICLERGKAFAHFDNRAKMIFWLKQSLFLDCRTVESLERLLASRLSFAEEQAFLGELVDFGCFKALPMLQTVFTCMMGKHDCSVPADTKFEARADRPVLSQLQRDPDLLSLKAEARYFQRDAQGAEQLTQFVLKELPPPTHPRCALVHVAAMVELGKVSELFYFAHKQVAESPKAALSWYCVGAYYYSARRFDVARKFFAKASMLDPLMLEAQVGSAHSLAMNEESDRAIATYRTAQRMFPGAFEPMLGAAMEYLRTNNPALAQQFGELARSLCEADPQVYNELGVTSYRMRDFPDACAWFELALGKACAGLNERSWATLTFETLVFNYAHALRRAGRLEEAVAQFKLGLSRAPKNAAGHAALGLTRHLKGEPGLAVESYHASLGLRPNDTLVAELMEVALSDLYSSQTV